MRKNIAGLLTGLLLVCSWSPSYALKVGGDKDNPDTFFKINMLMQPWVQLTYAKSKEPKFSSDFFIRRTRFLLGGSINKYVGFFMETDMPNLGKGRAFNQTNNFVQDAIVMFKFSKALNINFGMILPGFARDFFTSAVALHGYDYHGAQAGGGLAYPGLGGGTLVWRDTGIQALGWLAEDKFEYRFSISTGVANEDMIPRFTLRLAYNLLDAEAKLFPAATYLGKKKVVSIGVALDMQPGGYHTETGGDPDADPPVPPTVNEGLYLGVAGDIMWDLPMGPNRLTGSTGLCFYKLDESSQMALWFDVGYALGKFEPYVSTHYSKFPDADFDGSYFDIHAALMHWTFGHNMNLKLDVGLIKPAGAKFDGDGMQIVTTFRSQMFF